MKQFSIVMLFAACAVAGAAFSWLVTTAAWSIQVEPRAFQCNDSFGWPFADYWTGMHVHKAAGDTISAGWTWEEIESIRNVYVTAYFLIWTVSALIPFEWIRRRLYRPTAPAPIPRHASHVHR